MTAQKDVDTFKKIINEIRILKNITTDSTQRILQKNPLVNKRVPKKSLVLEAFNNFVQTDPQKFSAQEVKKIRKALQMKSTRTISGVTPVTVLTKPFPCPGKCIFCPSDIRMPKSYLSSEPGAQRAATNKFDPYLQTYNRLCAYANMGHPTDKIELIILGGTWSAYPKDYQIWFIKRCFDAFNSFNSGDFNVKTSEGTVMPFDEAVVQDAFDVKGTSYNAQVTKNSRKQPGKNVETASWDELFKAHKANETALTRCIGLVIETRPEYVTEEEMVHARKLGATKIQMGIQSLNDEVLILNKRGHTVDQTRKAFVLLRKYGFKIHGHWMPNLYGSSVEADIQDYKLLFAPDFCPDELKIYPCSLLESAELMDYYKKDLWLPYSEEELSKVLVEVFRNTPRYCRLTRVIRDIPSQEIVVGNKKTNFRQIVDKEVARLGIAPVEIRAREVRGKQISTQDTKLSVFEYKTSTTREFFIEYITEEDLLAGFLRLSLPNDSKKAMIREIHVYGKSLQLGLEQDGAPQHSGFGKSLIKKAKEISKQNKYDILQVISSVGTREYYRKRGFKDGDLYQHLSLRAK